MIPGNNGNRELAEDDLSALTPIVEWTNGTVADKLENMFKEIGGVSHLISA